MKWLRRKLVQYLVKNLLVAITEDDILLISNKEWLLKKRKLSSEEIISLKEEAQSFQSSLLWKLMRNELRWLSNRQMFDQLQNPDDMIFGKAMLYDLEKIKDFIEKLKSL